VKELFHAGRKLYSELGQQIIRVCKNSLAKQLVDYIIVIVEFRLTHEEKYFKWFL